VVGAAGAIGYATQREHNHPDRSFAGCEDPIVERNDAVGIIEKILGILKTCLA
jgi:hypothetical protein